MDDLEELNEEQTAAYFKKLVEDFKNEHGENFIDVCTEYAEEGDPKMQLLVGAIHGLGLHTLKDYISAYKWFNIAASMGDETGLKIRDGLEPAMSKDHVARAQELSVEWLENYSKKQKK